MKYKWLNKNNNDKLIIFFNGWGMDDYIVSHLDCEDYDVIVFYDYNDLKINIDLSLYKEKHVVGWSMGVMISTLFDFGTIKTRTALCGTTYPINDNLGIPERIYSLTIKNFSEKSVQKFMKRMFNTIPNKDIFTYRKLDSLKSELVKLLSYQPDEKVNFTKAIIPEDDLIIPTKNQLNFWSDKNIIKVKIPTGHCPFDYYKNWSEILLDL